MRWIGQHIWSLITRFRNSVYFEDLEASTETTALVVDADGKVSTNTLSGGGGSLPAGGTDYQVLRKASGTDYDVEWNYADRVTVEVRFDEAVSKGDPLYITGFNSGQNRVTVAKADASDSGKMPSIGLAYDDYSQSDNGQATTIGNLDDVNTQVAPNDFQEGDVLYVKAGGGLTNVKPTGTNLIQNVGKVSRRQQNNGEIVVMAIGRSNDVPNLPTGKFFIGSATNTQESAYTLPTSDGLKGQALVTNGLGVVGFQNPRDSFVIASQSAQVRLNINNNYYTGNDDYGWAYPIWLNPTSFSTSFTDFYALMGIIIPKDLTNLEFLSTVSRSNGNGTSATVELFITDRPNGSTSNMNLVSIGSVSTGAFNTGVVYNADINLTGLSLEKGQLLFVAIKKTGGTNTTTYGQFNFTIIGS